MKFSSVTEEVQWGDGLLFKVGGKMFAVGSMEPNKVVLSFKVSPEKFAELVEQEGVIPAPYLARASWVAMESWDAIPVKELKQLLREAYELVMGKLPKKIQVTL